MAFGRILKAERVAHGVFHFFQRRAGNPAGRRGDKAAWVERAELEAKKNRLHRQTAFGSGDAHVRRIIPCDVLALRADHHRGHERQAVDGVNGKHQNGPLPGLLAACNRVQVDKVNLASLRRLLRAKKFINLRFHRVVHFNQRRPGAFEAFAGNFLRRCRSSASTNTSGNCSTLLRRGYAVNRLRSNPSLAVCRARTFIFAGKAVPGYELAKLIIKLINDRRRIARRATRHSRPAEGRVPAATTTCTHAERIIPAADVSQQISTAGYGGEPEPAT